ncbi:hypothetical protein [Leptospira wolffii]|nr:hypothetical protein [Leptospira wolffii]
MERKNRVPKKPNLIQNSGQFSGLKIAIQIERSPERKIEPETVRIL